MKVSEVFCSFTVQHYVEGQSSRDELIKECCNTVTVLNAKTWCLHYCLYLWSLWSSCYQCASKTKGRLIYVYIWFCAVIVKKTLKNTKYTQIKKKNSALHSGKGGQKIHSYPSVILQLKKLHTQTHSHSYTHTYRHTHTLTSIISILSSVCATTFHTGFHRNR